MDERQIALFDQELRHLRETAAEFGRAFPNKARALGLGPQPPDPYVERLLEGTAFMAARVRRELDGQFAGFVQGLLECMHPEWLAPVPSMAIVSFRAPRGNPPPPGGLLIRRGSEMKGVPREYGDFRSLAGEPVGSVFSIVEDVTVAPVLLEEAKILVRSVSASGAAEDFGVPAALRLRLRKTTPAPWHEISLNPLRLYLTPQDGLEHRLLEQLLSHAQGISIRSGGKTVWKQRGKSVKSAAFEDASALIPSEKRASTSCRLLREFFAIPERFMFLDLVGVAAGLRSAKSLPTPLGDEIEVVVGLGKAFDDLEPAVNAGCIALYCAPAVNIFKKSFSQILPPGLHSEFHVVPDCNRPLDFEVFDLVSVRGFGSGAAEGIEFRPLFDARHQNTMGAASFAVKRRIRMATDSKPNKSGAQTSYPGTEVFLALSDPNSPPVPSNLAELAFEARCTNRHLPVDLRDRRGVWILERGMQADIELLAGPTLPHYVPVEGEYGWSLLNLLSSNYFSSESDPARAAEKLGEWLAMHAKSVTRGEGWQAVVASLRRLKFSPVLRSLTAADGLPALLRGVEITLEVEESSLRNQPVYLLALVLGEYLARESGLNSFNELVLKTWPMGEERMRAEARIGGLVR